MNMLIVAIAFFIGVPFAAGLVFLREEK